MQRWKVSQLCFLVDGFRQSGFVVILSAVLRSGIAISSRSRQSHLTKVHDINILDYRNVRAVKSINRDPCQDQSHQEKKKLNAVVLYGSPMSLYTGRARSYLIKTGVPYREVPHASPHFYKTVLPKAGGRRGIPTLEFPDGNVIRDGVAIIDHFENLNGHQHAPKTPKQNIVSLLLDVIAAEGLLRPCMYYRWNQDQDNLDFLRFHFQTIYRDKPDPVKDAEDRMKLIRETVNPAWGVTPETHDFIEKQHLSLLKRLNNHFSIYPYFLGSKLVAG